MAKKEKHLGEFEILILAAILRLNDHAYGVVIRQEVEARTDRNISVGALYTTLSRLEKKTYIASQLGEATAERGGRAKRYFKLTPAGRAQLEKSIRAINNMVEGTAWLAGSPQS